MRRIIFYENEDNLGRKMYHSYKETKQAINDRLEIISTTQMCFLSTDLFDIGYEIWIKPKDRDAYEIILGSNNDITDREIRMCHNLFKLWQGGEFD
jgi:hypothetical protein